MFLSKCFLFQYAPSPWCFSQSQMSVCDSSPFLPNGCSMVRCDEQLPSLCLTHSLGVFSRKLFSTFFGIGVPTDILKISVCDLKAFYPNTAPHFNNLISVVYYKFDVILRRNVIFKNFSLNY